MSCISSHISLCKIESLTVQDMLRPISDLIGRVFPRNVIWGGGNCFCGKRKCEKTNIFLLFGGGISSPKGPEKNTAHWSSPMQPHLHLLTPLPFHPLTPSSPPTTPCRTLSMSWSTTSLLTQHTTWRTSSPSHC